MIGAALLVAFVLVEQRVAHPLLPLRVVADRSRGMAFAAVGIAGLAMFGLFLFLTYYLQLVQHFSPVTSGLAFLPMIACVMISSNTSNIVTLPRFGPRIVITVGMVTGLPRTGLPQPHRHPFLLCRRRVARADADGLRDGHGDGAVDEHRDRRGAAAGLRRRRSAGEHDAAGRRLDRHGGDEHDRCVGDRVLRRLPREPAGFDAAAATHGYTVAFLISALVFAAAVCSRRRCSRRRNAWRRCANR